MIENANVEEEPKNRKVGVSIRNLKELIIIYISTHAYTHVLRLSLDLPYEKR
jgi:hypothetical protein